MEEEFGSVGWWWLRRRFFFVDGELRGGEETPIIFFNVLVLGFGLVENYRGRTRQNWGDRQVK